MKKFNQSLLFAFAFLVVLLSNCTHDNQIIEPTSPLVKGRDLLSVKADLPPTIDGIIDDSWANAPALEYEAVVPETANPAFRSYIGQIIPKATLKSMYDADHIYFLAEWLDPTESVARQKWYFDPSTKRWARESGSPTFGPNGGITRRAFGEDKFAMLWNINNSVAGWNTATCFKSCHANLSLEDGGGRHFTNYFTERIDMWH